VEAVEDSTAETTGVMMLHQAEAEVVAEVDSMEEMTLETIGALEVHPWVVAEEEAAEASTEATTVVMAGEAMLHQ